jgi:uncharacterized BrkB/YihY/UPF0761 family membrane protein
MNYIDNDFLVAIIAAMLNILFSLILPVIFKDNELPFSQQIRQNYNYNRSVIILSSVLVIIFVYTSLKITPYVRNKFANLAKLA